MVTQEEVQGIESYDFVKTNNGRIFVVYGSFHREGFVRGFLRYYPHPEGDRFIKNERYRRREINIDSGHPELIRIINMLGYEVDIYAEPDVVWIPIKDIEKVYRSRENLEQYWHKLRSIKKRDLKIILSAFELEEDSIGLIGSQVFDMVCPIESDVDILAMGEKNHTKLLTKIREDDWDYTMQDLGLTWISLDERLKTADKLSNIYGIPPTVAFEIMMKDHVKFSVRDEYFIGFVLGHSQEEAKRIDYGNLTDKRVTLSGEVVDSRGRFSNPRYYRIRCEEGEETLADRVLLVSTYLHLYKNVANEGEKVEVHGVLTDKGNIILNRKGDYIKPIIS